jgi:hypothetical protein
VKPLIALLLLLPAASAAAQATPGSTEPAPLQASPVPEVTPVTPPDPLAALAAEGRWDELHGQATERLAQDGGDELAQYWLARAEIQRSLPLIAGREFARDLGHTMLRRAGEQLAAVAEHPSDATADAREWEAYARYLRGDEGLSGDLEAWFERDGRGYAAFLRGLLARDQGDPQAARAWLSRACAAQPARGDFALELAAELGRAGQREQALQAWSVAARTGIAWGPLLATLAEVLPGAENAAQRLAQQETLLTDDAARQDGLLAWHRAWSLEQMGRPAEALAAFEAAAEGRTTDLERAHARLLASLGRTAEAAAHLRTAASAGDAEALSDLVSLADRLAFGRSWDEALAQYDAALAIEPRDERAAVNRALTLAQSGRTLDAWRELAAKHPDRADLLNDGALQFQGWGRDAEAREMFERAALLPGSLDARQNLADVLLQSHPPDPERALALADAVLAEEPSRDWAMYLHFLARRARAR